MSKVVVMVLVPLLVLRGADVAHALDAVDRFFQRNGDSLLDRVGVGANIVARHIHLRRRKIGIHGDGQIGNADGSRENDQQRADSCEYRPVNKEINKQSKPSFLSVCERRAS